MATTIAPALGGGALFTQAGRGTSPGYDAIDRRRAYGGALQEGVMAATSFEVVQRAAGANLSVDVTANAADAGTGVAAYVQGDAVTGQGLYAIPAHTAVINEAIASAHATLPRVDIVVLEILDTTHDASGSNLARVRVISGTATSGATLDNRTGAASLPSSCLLLADVLVPATDTTISNSQIRDRRKWARGANYQALVTSGGHNIAASSTLIHADFNKRIECSGVPLIVSFSAQMVYGATGGYSISLKVDGSDVFIRGFGGTIGEIVSIEMNVPYTPSAGSHAFAWYAGGATVGYFASNSSNHSAFSIEEIVRQNAANNSTTSG